MVMAETRVLWIKLAEHKAEVEPTQLYYNGKCEANFYEDRRTERRKRRAARKAIIH